MKDTLVKPTEYIMNLFSDKSNSDLDTILKFQKDLDLKDRYDLINRLFCQRTGEEIIKDGFVTGCQDVRMMLLCLLL